MHSRSYHNVVCGWVVLLGLACFETVELGLVRVGPCVSPVIRHVVVSVFVFFVITACLNAIRYTKVGYLWDGLEDLPTR